MNDYARAQEHLTDLFLALPLISNETGRQAITYGLARWNVEVSITPGTPNAVYCEQLLEQILRKRMALAVLGRIVSRLEPAGGDQFVMEAQLFLPSEFFLLKERTAFIADMGRFIPAGHLDEYYVRVVGHGYLDEITTAQQLVDILEDLPADPDSDDCHPLIRLTEAIAETLTDESIREKAREWSARIAANIDEIAAEQPCDSERLKLNNYRRRAAVSRGQSRGSVSDAEEDEAMASEVRNPSLMVLLDHHGPERKFFKLAISLYASDEFQKKLYTNDNPMTLDSSRDKITDALKKAIRERQELGRVTYIDVEFILPRDLLHLPVEEWLNEALGHMPLGARHIVVVRDLKRLRNPLLWPQWQRKWQKFNRNGTPLNAIPTRWITCADPPCQAGQGTRRMFPPHFISLGLTFPPPPEATRLELFEALDAGTPIVLYPRHKCEHPAGMPADGLCPGSQFKDDICTLLSGTTLRQLPDRARQIRADDKRPLALALLWDDPDRLPDARDFRLDAPDHEEGHE